MPDDIKRLNYFTGQFLDAADFLTEQTYHKEMRWRGNRVLFGPGVSVGMEVKPTADNKAITVGPGVAFDAEGRELVILPAVGGTPTVHDVPNLTGQVNVVVSYDEVPTDSRSSVDPSGTYTGATRVTEVPKIEVQAAGATASQILLATLQLDPNSAIVSVNPLVRQTSPVWLEPGHTIFGKGRLHIHGDELLFLLNKSGVHISKAWGGNGNLGVEGQLNVNGDVVVGTGSDAESRKLILRGPNSPTGPASAQDISYEFNVAGSAKVRAYRGSSWGTALQLLTNSAATGKDQPDVRLHVDETGNVGIGTTNPTNLLHVAGTLGIRQNRLHLSGDAGGSSLSYNAHRNAENSAWVFPDPTRTAVTLEIDDGGGSGKARFDVWTTTTTGKQGWAPRLRVDGETGYVGIGTLTPNAALHVSGEARITSSAIVGGALKVRLLNGKHDANDQEGELFLNWGTGHPVHIGGGNPAPPNALYVHGNLNVVSSATVNNLLGIGTSSPQAPLHIHQQAPGSGIRLDDPTSATNFRIYYENGNQVVAFYHYDGNGGALAGQWMGPGGEWNIFSDASLKKNVVELRGTLDKVMRLRPVSFDLISNDMPGIGFIAQDVELVLPELVSERSSDGVKPVKGLAYTNFGVLAIAAIQEMKNEYEARIGALEARLQAVGPQST